MKLDILAIIRAPLELYPPSLNQISLLAEAGLRIGVVDTFHPNVPEIQIAGPHRVERIHAGQHQLQFSDKSPNLVERFRRIILFRNTIVNIVRRRRPRVIIAYDPAAMYETRSLSKKFGKMRLIWHFHEIFTEGNRANWLTRQSIRYSENAANRIDLRLFPDAGRAKLFSERTSLDQLCAVVMNCPRRQSGLPEDKLRPKLRELGFEGYRVVYFQGDISSSRRPEIIIQSMIFWPMKSLLVMVGPIEQNYKQTLLDLAQLVGVAGRILFFGTVPYSDIWSLAVGADVGCSLVHEPSDPNWVYSAGAINKRFEYMAVGLPQVANIGPGMREIIEETGCGMLADPTSSVSVGNSIAAILNDQTLREMMSEKGRAAHLLKFNYENQFSTVLSRILEWCHE